MNIYTVKPGDVIGVLAVKFRTTIRILMADNPFIPANQELKVGWKLKVYTPEENAIRNTTTAYDQIEFAHSLRDQLETTDYILATPTKDVTYKERKVLDGQIGFVRIKKQTALIEVQANGYEKRVRWLADGEILRVYEIAVLKGRSMYLVDEYRWITSDTEYVLYDEIPLQELDGKIRLNKKSNLTVQSFMAKSLVAPNTSIGLGPKQTPVSAKVKPSTFIGAGQPMSKDTSLVKPVLFERPGYKRPIMNLENAAGEKAVIELRTTGFSATYGNTVQQSATNGGWMINVRASNLPVLNITGFLIETKASNEFNDFMSRYHKYMAAKKTNDYYGLGISKLFYKQTEYKGIVVGFSYTDREDETFHRKYNMQFLVLNEKLLSTSEYNKVAPLINRNGQSEAAFRSDIMNQLINTVTGNSYAGFYD
ncbi:LysM peptidoglycan-binding domain-containing protein [Priestia megaterium]|uniref:LysM peptidoglycan-binding domain-containing protein n=1 Tax=Priestia megaterium TaxID=1404 RepID=UPI003D01A390